MVSKTRSPNAARQQRFRRKAVEQGWVQCNIRQRCPIFSLRRNCSASTRI
jgi:hypothetical protein